MSSALVNLYLYNRDNERFPLCTCVIDGTKTIGRVLTKFCLEMKKVCSDKRCLFEWMFEFS